MKNFKSWGLRIRRDLSKNYYSVWNDLVTVRPDIGETSPLDPERSEFYDVGITERCNAMCPFCFPGDTRVNTDKGLVPISNLKLGDKILSRNMRAGNTELRTVCQLHSLNYSGDLIKISLGSGKEVESTPDHQFYTMSRGWTKARLLTESDSIYPGEKIVGISRRKFKGAVYNLGEKKNNVYFVSGVLVHNCYVEADSKKQDYADICKTWKSWMDTFPKDVKVDPRTDSIFHEIITEKLDLNKVKPEEVKFQVETFTSFLRYGGVYTEKPTQIAIGSVGEGTVHPEFCKFLETVYETRVVPNYTTNGIILGDPKRNAELLEATRNFCGGVAVSFGNKLLRGNATSAIKELLLHGECKVMMHEIIGCPDDVDELVRLNKEYGTDIHYHVLLPLMAHGRSKEKMTLDTYDYLTETLRKYEITNVAFGANFLPFMKKRPGSVNVWEYPKEIYSKNILLKDGKVIITPNSFRADEHIKTIDVL